MTDHVACLPAAQHSERRDLSPLPASFTLLFAFSYRILIQAFTSKLARQIALFNDDAFFLTGPKV